MHKKVELLAPAGNLEKLKFAFLYGADACYIGGRNYSLRANAKNFSIEEIQEAVKYAHNLNKKVYVTVNIVFHNEDIKGIKEYLFSKKYTSAIEHLFKVASGLDSIVLGEDQILGQVKDAHDFSMQLGSSKKIFNKLFREAVNIAKDIKNTTKI